MRKLFRAVALVAGLWPAISFGQVPFFPQTLPPSTVVGRLGLSAGPTEAIPFLNLVQALSQQVIPGSGSLVVGPATSVVGDIAVFANTTGNLIKDFGNGTVAAPLHGSSDATSGIFFDVQSGLGKPSLSVGGIIWLGWQPNQFIGSAVTNNQLTLQMAAGTDGNNDSSMRIQPNISGTGIGSATMQLYAIGASKIAEYGTFVVRGTVTSPTATQAGDELGAYWQTGYDGVKPSLSVPAFEINGFADENFDNTHHATIYRLRLIGPGAGAAAGGATVHFVDGNGNHIIEQPSQIIGGQNLSGKGVIYLGVSTAPTIAPALTRFQIYNAGAGQLNIDSYGDAIVRAAPGATLSGNAQFAALALGTSKTPRFAGFNARGVGLANTATQNGDNLSQWDGTGFDTTNQFGDITGLCHFIANENFTSTNHGTYYECGVTPNGSLTAFLFMRGLGVTGAVNYLTITNAATGNGPIISANGEANIDVNINSVSGGKVRLNTIAYPGSLTSGGVLYASTATNVASSALLVANGVVIGGGAGTAPSAVGVGTNGQVFLGVTGAAPTFATMSGDGTITNAGVLTVAKINGSFTAHGVLLGEGSGAFGVTAAGAAGTVLVGSGVGSDPSFGVNLSLGIAGTASGQINLAGTTSGVVSVLIQNAAGTYNFNLPTSAGTSGQPLLSGGGGGAAMTFGTLGVAGGGTGDTTLASNGVLYGNGTGAVQITAQGAANTVLTANAGAPSFSAAITVGTSVTSPLLIGGTAAGSSLTIESTSGAGTTDFIAWKTASQTERMRLNTSGQLGIGTSSQSVQLQVVGGTTTIAPELVAVTTRAELQGADSEGTAFTIDAFGSALVYGSFHVRKAAGTAAAPIAVQSGDFIGGMNGNAATGAGTYSANNKVAFFFTAAETWDTTHFGTNINYYTTVTGGGSPGATEKFRMWASGGYSIGNGVVTTDPGSGGLIANGATIEFTALANVATTSAVCYNTGSGLITYDGTIGTCTVSDERLKNMGSRIDSALEKLLAINGVYGTWKDPTMGSGRQIFIGAQTVEQVFPELVQTDSTGKKSLDYQRLTAPIIEAIRELKADNDNLRAELNRRAQ